MPRKNKKIKQKQKQKQQQTVIINIGREKRKTRRRKSKSPDKAQKEYIPPAVIPPIMVNPPQQPVPNQSQPIPLAFQQPVPVAFQQPKDISIVESQPVGIEASQLYEEPSIIPPITKQKVVFEDIENPKIIFPDIEEETKSGFSTTEASDVDIPIKRRGRPKGSRNKYKSTRGVEQINLRTDDGAQFHNPRIPFMSDPLGIEDIPIKNPFYEEEDTRNMVDSLNVIQPETDNSLINMIAKVNRTLDGGREQIQNQYTEAPYFQQPPKLTKKKPKLRIKNPQENIY